MPLSSSYCEYVITILTHSSKMALKQNIRIIETTRLQTSRIAVYLLIIHLLLFSLARMNCMQLHKKRIF